MKRATSIILIVLWILFASFCLTYWMINYSAGIIPNPPEAFWVWIIDAMGAYNRKTDAIIFVGLIVSTLIVSVSTLFVWLLWHHIKLR